MRLALYSMVCYYTVLTLMDVTGFESGAMAKEFYGMVEFFWIFVTIVLIRLKFVTHLPMVMLGYFGLYLVMLNLGYRGVLPTWMFMNDAAKHQELFFY